MTQRTVTMKGNPLPLSGDELAVGAPLPAFTVVDKGLAPVTAADLLGRIKVIATVPSLDTPVCDLEVRRFNQEATQLGDQVEVLVVSTDLPFAQARWCGAAGVERVRTLSDHRGVELGRACGVLLEDLRLLARAVFVVDAGNIVRYVQLVPEIGAEPDYAAVLDAVKALV